MYAVKYGNSYIQCAWGPCNNHRGISTLVLWLFTVLYLILFASHMVWWFCEMWNSNLYYTAAPGPESNRKSVRCHYWLPEQIDTDLEPEWLEKPMTVKHLPVPYLPRSRCGSVRAAELPKKNRSLSTLVRHWNSVKLHAQPTHGPLLESLTFGEQHTHIYHIYIMFTTLCWLLYEQLGLYTHLDTHIHFT